MVFIFFPYKSKPAYDWRLLYLAVDFSLDLLVSEKHLCPTQPRASYFLFCSVISVLPEKAALCLPLEEILLLYLGTGGMLMRGSHALDLNELFACQTYLGGRLLQHMNRADWKMLNLGKLGQTKYLFFPLKTFLFTRNLSNLSLVCFRFFG